MKLVTFSSGVSQKQIGIMGPEGLIDVHRHLPDAPKTMMELAGSWDQWRSAFERISRYGESLPQAKFHAPIPRPGKIMAIGLNYADHVAESGMKTPEQQIWFSKMPSSVAGPHED